MILTGAVSSAMVKRGLIGVGLNENRAEVEHANVAQRKGLARDQMARWGQNLSLLTIRSGSCGHEEGKMPFLLSKTSGLTGTPPSPPVVACSENLIEVCQYLRLRPGKGFSYLGPPS